MRRTLRVICCRQCTQWLDGSQSSRAGWFLEPSAFVFVIIYEEHFRGLNSLHFLSPGSSRYREPLMGTVTQTMWCLLAANKALLSYFNMKPLFLSPPAALLKAVLKYRGEILVWGLFVPFQYHTAMLWRVPLVFLEGATFTYLFSFVADWYDVVFRFAVASVISCSLSWWWDWRLRSCFVSALGGRRSTSGRAGNGRGKLTKSGPKSGRQHDSGGGSCSGGK